MMKSDSYRLLKEGYSPSAHTLLIAGRHNMGHDEALRLLTAYDEETRVARILFPLTQHFFDFAWSPTQPAFVVTHARGMILFEQDGSEDGYGGMSIACPTHLSYHHCSWSPAGAWLAVNCYNTENASGPSLGLYNLKESRFLLSDIVMDYMTPIWKDDGSLYVVKDNNAMEVTLQSGTAKVTQSIPMGQEVASVLGLCNNRMLVYTDDGVILGTSMLARLLEDIDFRRVIGTPTTIFVSVSSEALVAFDREGNEIDRANPGKVVLFGSTTGDSGTVYGLADSTLLRISVRDGRLSIEETCNLAKLLRGETELGNRRG